MYALASVGRQFLTAAKGMVEESAFVISLTLPSIELQILLPRSGISSDSSLAQPNAPFQSPLPLSSRITPTTRRAGAHIRQGLQLPSLAARSVKVNSIASGFRSLPT